MGACLFVLISGAALAAAPGASSRFGRLTIADGLAQSSVIAIAQDQAGYMWFGTEDGLHLYDGYHFRIFRHDPGNKNSIASGFINRLLVDSEGLLWVATYGSGLDSYDPTTGVFTHHVHTHSGVSRINHNNIWALEEDDRGGLWVGTGDGLEYRDPATGEWTLYRTSEPNGAALYSNHVWALERDDAGVLWIGTHRGLNYLPPGENEIRRFADPDYPDLFEQVSINALERDSAGRLWIGLEAGLIRLNRDHRVEKIYGRKNTPARGFSGSQVRSILVTRDGDVWAGTYDGGVNHLAGDAEIFTAYRNDLTDPTSLVGDRVIALYEDMTGLVWIGAEAAGVSTFNPATRQFTYYKHNPLDENSLVNNMVWALLEESPGKLWIGTDGGLSFLNRDTGQYRHYAHDPDNPRSLSTNYVSTLYRDRQNRLWVGTGEGLHYFDQARRNLHRVRFETGKETELDTNNILTLLEDSEGRFWVGTAHGLFLYDRDSGDYRWYRHEPDNPRSLAANLVLTLHQAPDGTVWVGTDGGLHRYDESGGDFATYTASTASGGTERPRLANNSVQTIYAAPDNSLWIGTVGGISHFIPAESVIRHYTTADGLPNNTVYCILPDSQGHLWISTNSGLTRFDPQTGEFSNHGVADGLQSAEFNAGACTRNTAGELFFGGINGFNAFNPDMFTERLIEPKLTITNIYMLNQQARFGLHIPADFNLTLTHEDNAVFFEFALFDYTAPGRNTFAYMLEGFDAGWRENGRENRVSYTNLDPGEYVFRVHGETAHGVASANEASIAISALPPPWRTWWAYVLYAFAALLLIYVLLRAHAKRVAHEHQLDAARHERRWAETLHQLSQALAASLDARTVASQLADHLGRMVEFNIAALFVEQGSEISLVGSRGLTGSQERKLSVLPEQGVRLLAEFRHVRRPVRFDRSYLPLDAFVEETPHIQQYLAVPIVSRAEELALLLLGRSDKSFGEQDVEIASAFARQALTALDNARLFAEVQNLGTTDSLTRVHNRRFFFEQAELEFTRSRRYQRDLALILLDADHFRDINDLYGQDVGDRVLKIIANMCRSNLRHFDFIGRYSGESFIILLPETKLNVAADVADRLRKCVEDMRVETHRGELRVTASVGVAVNHNGEEAKDLSALINRADMALYEAKRGGRNRVVVAQQ